MRASSDAAVQALQPDRGRARRRGGDAGRSCMSCAVPTHLPAGTAYTTLEVKINFGRAPTDQTGPIRAEARTLHVGRRAGTAEGKIIDGAGRLYAHGTTT